MADSDGESLRLTLVSIGVSTSICITLVGVEALCGVMVGWDRGCEVGGVLILCRWAAGAATGVLVRGQASLLAVSTGFFSAGGVEPEGRRRRLAAWASSADETS